MVVAAARRAARVLATGVLATGVLLAGGGCATLPPLSPGRLPSYATLEDSTALARALAPETTAHPGESGLIVLSRPLDAYAARAVLAAAAERTLDVQYYIWHGDRTGQLMAAELWDAADRGVRVRLLLDDLPTAGLDRAIAVLDAHPSIEVRLYNPFANRRVRFFDYVMDFRRIHKRMHNKTFTADNAITILGGRNIGDEYFGLGEEMLFADLDVAAAGEVVRAVAYQFDLYWNSRSAYPASQMIRAAKPSEIVQLRAQLRATRDDSASVSYIEAVRATPLVQNLRSREPVFHWAPTTLVYDDPEKTRSSSPREDALLTTDLIRIIGRPESTLDLVSPYFVPGRDGAASIGALAREGVRVRVLTNSLAATDVAAVHAGYVKSRRRLLRDGVELYEFHPLSSRRALAQRIGEPARPRGSAPNIGGSRGSRAALALHAKTFAVDSTRLFIGSFNFDPRSTHYNTELGVIIESPFMARGLHDEFARNVPVASYAVRFGPEGRGLEWLEHTDSGTVVHRSEPRAPWYRRLAVSVLRYLPIDWLM